MFEKYVCAKCIWGEGILRCTYIEGQGIVDVNHDTVKFSSLVLVFECFLFLEIHGVIE